MKTILITGAAGFIGRHLVQRVLETTDWRIVALDGLSYAADTLKLVHDHAYDKSRVRLLWHDLRAPLSEDLIASIGDVDYVANVASASHVDRSISDPAVFFLNNASLIANMLEYARATRPEKFLQVSTDEVFGPAYAGYCHKEWDPHVPSNPYSASKSAQEALCIAYWRTYGLPLIITNTMNNFGEGQHPEKFVPMIVRKLLADEEIAVHGKWVDEEFIPGSRYWLHASSHADALIYLLSNMEPARYPDTDRPSRWNVVGDCEVDNLEMVGKIGAILGKRPKVSRDDFHSSRPGHDLRYALDGEKLKAEGWSPRMDFEESLVQSVTTIASCV
jgi:dTDP-glucose 4,6-dehydratase